MLQKVLLERDDLEALRRGEDKLIMIGDQRILLGFHGRLNGVVPNVNGRPKGPGVAPKVFSVEFKHVAKKRMRNGMPVPALAKELGVRQTVLYSWRKNDANMTAKARRRLLRAGKNGVRLHGSDGRKIYAQDFKVKAAARVKAGESAAHVAKQLKVRRELVRGWARGRGLTAVTRG